MNYYLDLPAIEGPWRELFIYGFAAGAYEVLPELEKQSQELQKQLEQMQRLQSRTTRSARETAAGLLLAKRSTLMENRAVCAGFELKSSNACCA